jgi:hypothetical protein
MRRVATLTCGLFILCGVAEFAAIDAALARGGGGGNIMNSPGYQRRLQESRGQVTVQSVTKPYTRPPSPYRGHQWRQRGRR